VQVYLSSTYIDLKDYRETVYRTLCKIEGVQVVAMEDYVACDERPVNRCLNDVEKCDAYIGLFAWRYGFIPDGREYSITNLEYLKAIETNKPTFIFLLNDKVTWIDDFIDKPLDNIENLRKELEDSLIVSYFKNKEDLSKEVAVVISNHLNKSKTIQQGIPPEEYQRLAEDFGVTKNAVKNFFKIIEQKDVPKEDWDFTLRQIATRHKELLSRLDQFNVTVDEEIQELRLKAEEAINEGDYDNADKYLDEAIERQMVCITNAEKELTNCKLSAAEMKVDKGDIELTRINYKAATKLFKEAVELVPDGDEHELKKAEYLQKFGDAAYYAGRYDESQIALEQCLAIREKLLPKDDLDLAGILNNLADLYRSQGKYEEAGPLYQRSLGINETKLGKDHPSVANTLNNLAELYEVQGKYEEAEYLFKRCLWIYEKALCKDQEVTTTICKDHLYAATTLNNLADLYRSQGKYEEAGPLYDICLGIYEKALGIDHPCIATVLNNIADLYFSKGNYEKAAKLYKSSLEILEKKLGIDHPSIARPIIDLAKLYFYQGEYEEAESFLERSLRIRETNLGKDHPAIAENLNNFALLYVSQGKYEKAESLYKRCLGMYEKALGKDHPDVSATLDNLAKLYYTQGKYEEAEPLFKRSLGIRETKLGKDHPSVATTLNNLAGLYEVQGKYEEAEPLYKRSLGIKEKTIGKDHPDVAITLNNLAGLYYHQGKYKETDILFKKVLSILDKSLGKNHSRYKTAKKNYMFILENIKKSVTIQKVEISLADKKIAAEIHKFVMKRKKKGKSIESIVGSPHIMKYMNKYKQLMDRYYSKAEIMPRLLKSLKKIVFDKFTSAWG